MPSSSVEGKKPPLYEGLRVPFDQLQPEEFEDFARQVLEFLGHKLDFRVTSQSGSSSDGGFDINAVRISSPSKNVCIQCKRYKSSLSVQHVALELAKAALTSALEKSTVVDHYFVTTAKKTQELESALRQSGRVSLVSEACTAAMSHKDLKIDRENAIAAGIDIQAIVSAYVQNLDKLEVWSGRDFDAKLGTVWSEIQDALARFFVVHTALREYPRPDFDESAYLDRCCLPPIATVPAFCRSTKLPANLERYSATDPRAQKHGSPYLSAGNYGDTTGPTVPVVETLAETPCGSCTILIGPGGGGKTRALESTRAHVAQVRTHQEDAPLPVMVELRNYDGDISRAVARALDINHGSWTSIPGRLLLLFDGLNELSHENASKLLCEVNDLLSSRRERIACVISTRDDGFRQRMVLSKIDRSFRIVPFDIRQTRHLAAQSFDDSNLDAFMTEFMRRLATPTASFLLLPFCVTASIAYFEENRTLPENRAALVEAILQRRFERNNERPLPQNLAEIPADTVRSIAEEIMFVARIERNSAVMSKSDATLIFKQALQKARMKNCFGADDLTPTSVLDLMCHYEFLGRGRNDRLLLPHDLVVGYLAARPLAEVWRSKLSLLASTSATDDAWLFACAHIPRNELDVFLVKLSIVDWMLAARAGAEAGGVASAMAEQALLYLDEQANTEFRVWEAANALALLGTPACIDRLRANAELPLDRSLRSLQNQRALARLGDELFLRQILHGETTDNTALDISGTWFSAPLHIALRLARQQIDDAPTNPSLRLALETIQTYCDVSDVDRVSRVFDAANDYFTSVSAFQCLLKLEPSRAAQKMREAMEGAGTLGKVHISKLLHEAGAPIDTEWLLGLMLGDAYDEIHSPETDQNPGKDRQFRIHLGVEKILEASTFDSDMKARIVRAYPGADPLVRSALWKFAGNNDMEEFDTYAHDVIQSQRSAEIGCVCGFLARRRLSETKKRQFIEALIVWVQRPQTLNWNWRGFAVIDFLIKNGHPEPAAAIGYGWLRTILEAHRSLRHGHDVERPSHGNIDVRAEVQGVAPEVGMEHLLSWILALVSTLAPVSNLLSHEGLDELFHIRISGVIDVEKRQALLKMFELFGCEHVNEKVRLETNSWERIALLRVAEPLLHTDRILRVLQEDASAWIDYPGPLEMVFDVIALRWDEQFARAVIDIIGQFSDWNLEVDAQYFDNTLLIWVGEHLQRDWVERFITPHWERELHPTSHRILTFWYEMVTHQRRG